MARFADVHLSCSGMCNEEHGPRKYFWILRRMFLYVGCLDCKFLNDV